MKCEAMCEVGQRLHFPPAATKFGAAPTTEKLGTRSDPPLLTICRAAFSPIVVGCRHFWLLNHTVGGTGASPVQPRGGDAEPLPHLTFRLQPTGRFGTITTIIDATATNDGVSDK